VSRSAAAYPGSAAATFMTDRTLVIDGGVAAVSI
jgi:hypothetical protein